MFSGFINSELEEDFLEGDSGTTVDAHALVDEGTIIVTEEESEDSNLPASVGGGHEVSPHVPLPDVSGERLEETGLNGGEGDGKNEKSNDGLVNSVHFNNYKTPPRFI